MRTILLALATLLASVPAGAHSFPAKAKTIVSSLVQAYPPCTTADTQTNGGTPACLDTTEVDPACLFGGKGAGTLQATISKTNVVVKGALTGLDPLCNGKTLTAAFTVRTTTDDCPMEHCTLVDQELTAGSCTVAGGKCKLRGTIASGFPAGAGSEMTILTCGVKDGSARAFTCGIMVK